MKLGTRGEQTLVAREEHLDQEGNWRDREVVVVVADGKLKKKSKVKEEEEECWKKAHRGRRLGRACDDAGVVGVNDEVVVVHGPVLGPVPVPVPVLALDRASQSETAHERRRQQDKVAGTMQWQIPRGEQWGHRHRQDHRYYYSKLQAYLGRAVVALNDRYFHFRKYRHKIFVVVAVRQPRRTLHY